MGEVLQIYRADAEGSRVYDTDGCERYSQMVFVLESLGLKIGLKGFGACICFVV